MEYHNRLYTSRDSVVKAFGIIDHFMKKQQNPLEKIILDCGRNYSCLITRQSALDDEQYMYKDFGWKGNTNLKDFISWTFQIRQRSNSLQENAIQLIDDIESIITTIYTETLQILISITLQ